MAGTIEKKITTKSDFQAGIVQFILTPEWVDGCITSKIDKTDNKVVSARLHPTFTGSSQVTENLGGFASQIVIQNFTPDYAYIQSDILPDQYEIKFSCNPNSVIWATGNMIFGGIMKFDGWIRIAFTFATDSKRKIFYTDSGGTKHYWNGSTWQLVDTSFGSATVQNQKVIIRKDSVNYTIEVYEGGSLITSASIAVASVYVGVDQEHFLSGSTNSIVNFDFVIVIWDIYGIFIDKYADKPAAFSSIIDLGQKPVLSGNYVETINNNWWDEENPHENYTGTYHLKTDINSVKLSQGFKLTKNGLVEKCRIVTKNDNCIAGDKIWIEIWDDDGTGKPNALISGYVSPQIDITTIMAGKTEITYTEFNFSSPTITLQKNIQYHIVIQGTWAVGTTASIRFENTGTYSKGKCCSYYSVLAIWVFETYDLVFGIKLTETQLITRKIGYSNTADYKTLNSKIDWEGNNESQSQIDTAVESGSVLLAIDSGGTGGYFTTGYIQNDIDLGVVPTNYLTFSAYYYIKPVDTGLVFKIATSDDGSSWSGFTTLTMIQGYCDLTALGKHRYWRVKIEFSSSDLNFTAKLFSWTLDHFSPMTEFDIRDKLQAFRYLKFLWLFETNNPLTCIELTEIYISYLIAYELYIKKVKYSISSAGIVASMELSSI